MKAKRRRAIFFAGTMALLLTACNGGAVNSNTNSNSVNGEIQSTVSSNTGFHGVSGGTQNTISNHTVSSDVGVETQSTLSGETRSTVSDYTDSSDVSGETQSQPISKPVKPEGKNMIWLAPKSIDYTTGMVMDDFVDKITDASNWSTLLQQTRVLKLYIQQLYTTPEADLKRIADFVREQGLLVAVELGGIRVAPQGSLPNRIGVVAAAVEYRHLKTFIDNGGRVDYITTDHALAANITGRTADFPQLDMEGLMRQQMEYYRYMTERIPQLKVGAIESLGFFWIKAGDRQYQFTDSTLPIRVDFEVYLSEMVRIAKEYSITLDHFHIDFGYHDVKYDKGYGRILATEDYIHSLGLDSGFIAANAFHAALDYPTSNEAAADRSAYEETLEYFEGYIKAGGHSDYLLFQRWQYYPIAVGTGQDKYTNMGIFKAMLDSKWFPKD